MRRKAAAAAPERKAGALGRALPPNCQRVRPQSPRQPAASAGRTRTSASAARYSGRAGRAAGAAGPSARGSEKGRGRSRERGPEPGAGPWRRAREGVGERHLWPFTYRESFRLGEGAASPASGSRALPPAPGVGVGSSSCGTWERPAWRRAEARIPFTTSLWLVLVLVLDRRNDAVCFRNRWRGSGRCLWISVFRERKGNGRMSSLQCTSKLPASLLLRKSASSSCR